MKRDVDQRILNFFQDPQKLIATKLEGLVKKHTFQMSMTKSLSSNFRKQVSHIRNLSTYNCRENGLSNYSNIHKNSLQ